MGIPPPIFSPTGATLLDPGRQPTFEDVLGRIQDCLLSAHPETLNEAIGGMQRTACQYLGMERSALWQGSMSEPTTLSLTHLYVAEGSPPERVGLTINRLFPWITGQLLAGQIVAINDPATLPPEAVVDRQSFRQYGANSILALPVIVPGSPIRAVLSFSAAAAGRIQDDATPPRCRVIAQLVAGAIARTKIEEALNQANRLVGIGYYALDVATGRWTSSALLDDIFGLAATAVKDVALWAATIHPADRESMVTYFQERVLGAREPFDREYRIIRQNDQAARWVHGLGELRFNSSGEPVEMFGTIQDITERKLAEITLRRDEARHRALSRILQDRSETIQQFVDFALAAALELVESKIGYIYFYDEEKQLFILNSWSREVMQQCAIAQPQTCYELQSTEIWGEAVRQRAPVLVNDFQASHPLKKGYPEGHMVLHRYLTLPVFAGDRIVAVVGVANKPSDYDERDIQQLRLLMEAVWGGIERRRAIDEMRKLARAVEQSPVSILITNPQGVIEYANPQFTRTSGHTFAEIKGMTPRVTKSEVQSAVFYQELWSTITAGREWRGEICNRRKDGTLYWEDMSISPLFGETGRITHFLAVKEDITDRREQRERIREQAAILNETRDVILLVDLERRIQFWNRGAEEVYGWSAAEVMGRDYRLVLYDTERPQPADVWPGLYERGEWQGEIRQRTKTGGTVVLRARARLLRHPNGDPKSALLTGSNVTQEKQIEHQFLRAQRLDSLGMLASGIAHDLNNVLAPILLTTGVLQSMVRNPQEAEVVQIIEQSTRRGADIVQQLLLFGRGTDNPHTTVDLAMLLRQFSRLMHETMPKTLSVDVQVKGGLWSVHGDSTQLHQVLLNLSVNARDAMPEGGDLSLSAENVVVDEFFAQQQHGAKPGPHVAVRVSDTGSGIDPANLERIFDPFFTTKPLGHGTGLGLATVLGILRAHRGFITVESRLGAGSCFTIFLPAQDAAATVVSEPAHRAEYAGHHERVLVVDDEPTIRRAMEHTFIQAGYQVCTAIDGADALRVYAEHRASVRLVVTDIMMPVMDGSQLIHALRRSDAHLPIIAMSGLRESRTELERMYRRLRFLPKPFLAELMLRAARELLEMPA